MPLASLVCGCRRPPGCASFIRRIMPRFTQIRDLGFFIQDRRFNHDMASSTASHSGPDYSFDQHVLSWQSCFWAILPIALNTMCQPSGRIVGFSVQDSFALRASPLVCAISTIDTISRILYTFIKGKSFPTSCRMLLKARRDEQANHGSFEDLRRNKIFRLTLFLLGALPQAIKVYACRGIPWIQGLCTMYLAPFVVDELAAWIAHFHSISGTSDEAVLLHQTTSNFPDNITMQSYGSAWLHHS